MQHRILLAFRKRLKNRGYTEISIYQSKFHPQNYIVRVREPNRGVQLTINYLMMFFFLKIYTIIGSNELILKL